jgi:hypothetical protein
METISKGTGIISKGVETISKGLEMIHDVRLSQTMRGRKPHSNCHFSITLLW